LGKIERKREREGEREREKERKRGKEAGKERCVSEHREKKRARNREHVPAVILIARSILLVTIVVTGNRGGLLAAVATLVIVLRAGPPPVVSATVIFVRSHRSRRTLLKAIAFLRIRRGTFEIGSFAPVAVARVFVGPRGTGRWAWGLILDAISWRRRLQLRHRVTDVPAIRDTPK